MMLRAFGLAFLLVLAWYALAPASSYDEMKIWEIRAHPDFVEDNYCLSAATGSGEIGADFVYEWVGYIPDGDKRVYFTSNGEPLTCVQWQATGEWVPEWVVEALDKLLEEGYIDLA
jgi:hypothetical protein